MKPKDNAELFSSPFAPLPTVHSVMWCALKWRLPSAENYILRRTQWPCDTPRMWCHMLVVEPECHTTKRTAESVLGLTESQVSLKGKIKNNENKTTIRHPLQKKVLPLFLILVNFTIFFLNLGLFIFIYNLFNHGYRSSCVSECMSIGTRLTARTKKESHQTHFWKWNCAFGEPQPNNRT